jgi:hypothetical protein
MHVPSAHEVETYTGRFVDTKRPHASTIVLEDIAHALGATCRYGGHCQRFYSVAEHAVFCSIRLERKGYGIGLQLAALHHDDAEAYLGDIPRPMKSLLGQTYKSLTDRMDKVIGEALGLDPLMFHHPLVKDADNWALFVEARHLLPSQGKHWFEGDQGAATWGLENQPGRIITPDYWHGGLEPDLAETLYIQRHRALTDQED